MRGVSNVISAIFVIAALLVASYLTLSAYITHTTELTLKANEALEREIRAAHIGYATGECNTDAGTISIPVIGTEADYSVRVACYDLGDVINTFCIVPYISTGEKSAQYVGPKFPETMELNMDACTGLAAACTSGRLQCVAIGAYASQWIPVEKI